MGRIFIECLDRKLKLRKVAKAVYRALGQISRFKVDISNAQRADEMYIRQRLHQ